MSGPGADLQARLAAARAEAGRGAFDQALAILEDAHARAPTAPEPPRLALEVLVATDDGPGLVGWGDRALRADPFDAAFNARFALGLELMGEADRAVVHLRRARALSGGGHAFALPLGRCLMHTGDLAAAVQVLAAALAAEAEPRARAMLERALGEARLKGGDPAGFALFQARDWTDGAAYAIAGIAPWRGEDLAGKTLLITHHLGYGDQIMLAPLAAAAAARRAAKVVLTCDPPLHALFAASLPGVTVLPLARPTRPGVSAPPALARIVAEHAPDLHASLLGACANLSANDIGWGANRSWLTAPPAVAEHSRAKLAELRRRHPGARLIGVAFDCIQHRIADFGPIERASARRRSVPIEGIGDMARVLADRFVLVSLHPPDHAQRIGSPPPNVEPVPGGIGDFADTAGLIEALDGVLSVDCSVANLAARQGRPTWVMLNAQGEWRWGRGGPISPWFPSIRLLRQRTPWDWSWVLNGAVASLRNHDFARPAG